MVDTNQLNVTFCMFSETFFEKRLVVSLKLCTFALAFENKATWSNDFK